MYVDWLKNILCTILVSLWVVGGVEMRVWLGNECVWSSMIYLWRCFVLRSSWTRSLIVVARCVSSGRMAWRACIHPRGFDLLWGMSDSSTRPVSCMSLVIFLSSPLLMLHWRTPLSPTVRSALPPIEINLHVCGSIKWQSTDLLQWDLYIIHTILNYWMPLWPVRVMTCHTTDGPPDRPCLLQTVPPRH